jgi:hypothetical protein
MIDNKEAALNKFQNYLELHLFQINKAKYKNKLNSDNCKQKTSFYLDERDDETRVFYDK